jgi:uncharacterized protein with HEPN domain
MSKRNDIDFIQDIKESIERAILYTKNMEYEEFSQDYKTQDAVIRNIEIMGEATKALSETLKKAKIFLQKHECLIFIEQAR